MKIRSIQTFGQPTIGDYYRAVTKQCKDEVNNLPVDKIAGTDTEELIIYLLQKYELSPLELDPAQDIDYEQIVVKEQVTGHFGEVFDKDITYARIHFPLKPYRDLAESFKYQTNTYTVTHHDFDFDERAYSVSIDCEPKEIEKKINEYTGLFGQRTGEIVEGSKKLKEDITQLVNSRKKQITQEDDSFEKAVKNVTIPIKKRVNNEMCIPLNIRKELRDLKAPESKMKKEIILTSEQLNSIVEIINSSGTNFENTPATYSKLDEPELRNVILTHLNHYFSDDATGETFTVTGKSDIRLKVSRGQILIAECKYWYGEKEFDKAIEQLFSYLTWRRNYGILIIFSKNKGFTDLLDTIQSKLTSHSTYKGGFVKISDSHLKSIHTFPSDERKEVEIRTLVYNLYTP